MGEVLEKLMKFMSSPEGQEYVKKVKAKMEWEDSWKNEKLSWFDSIGPEKRSHYIQKVINKYTSDSYKDRWYNRGIFPEEELYCWLYDYAYKYGKCWNAIYSEAGPGFDSKFLFDNWVITCYCGQGTKYIIRKATEEDLAKGPNKWAQMRLGREYDNNYYDTLTDEFA